jgi:hypothetical protein
MEYPMPRVKKQVPQQLSGEEQAVSIAGSIAPSFARFKGAGNHKRAANVVEASIDSQNELKGKQFLSWVQQNSYDTENLTVLRKGINLKSGARKLFGFLLKKIGKEHIIGEDGKASMEAGMKAKDPIRIGGIVYNPPYVSFTAYEAITETLGDPRRPSKKDYEDFERHFQELQDQCHIFTMRVYTGDNIKTVVVKSRIVIDVITESLDNNRSKRYTVSLHPITTAQLGNWWRLYPDDFENQIALRGGNRSYYIYGLADLVIYERDMKGTKKAGYFTRTIKTLTEQINLQDYEHRPKDLYGKIERGLDCLKGYLIDRYVAEKDQTGKVIKYRIYPVIEPVKEIENGAA